MEEEFLGDCTGYRQTGFTNQRLQMFTSARNTKDRRKLLLLHKESTERK